MIVRSAGQNPEGGHHGGFGRWVDDTAIATQKSEGGAFIVLPSNSVVNLKNGR